MKANKLTTLMAVAGFALAGQAAQAQTVFCVQLDTFCDSMTVTFDAGVFSGLWDWTCAGNLEEMLGARGVVGGLLADIATTESWVFDFPSRSVNIYFWPDGGSPGLLASDTFTITGLGTCPPAAGPQIGPSVNNVR